MLADVVGATSTAAVSFSDAKAATETLGAVAVNKNVRIAAILRDGASLRAVRSASPGHRRHLDPDASDTASCPRAARASHASRTTRSGCVRPILLDGELIGGVYIESGLGELHDRLKRLIGIIVAVLLRHAVHRVRARRRGCSG